MNEGKVFELQTLMAQLDKEGGYFLDFLKGRHLEAGIIVLHPDAKDTQDYHSVDELYYVIEGNGFLELGKKKQGVRKGTIIFVPAGTHHRFLGNSDDLVVLYIFA